MGIAASIMETSDVGRDLTHRDFPMTDRRKSFVLIAEITLIPILLDKTAMSNGSKAIDFFPSFSRLTDPKGRLLFI